MKPTIYVETSIPSYLAARPSRDLLIAAHQQATHAWWQTVRDGYDLYVSVATLREIRQGDPEAAARRLEFVAGIPVLRLNTEIRRLAGLYRESAGLPEGAGTDMAHVAFASFYETDYLVTWNCTHIANSVVIRRLTELSLKTGHYMPLIVTPEEFLWPQEETQDEA